MHTHWKTQTAPLALWPWVGTPMMEGSPEAQLSRARVAPVRMKLGLTTVSKRFSPRCGNVCTATLMCAHTHTAQGDGDEMTAARTSLCTRPRQNVHPKRPCWSLGWVAAAPGGKVGVLLAPTLWMCVVEGLLKGLVSLQKCQDTHTRCIPIFLMANFLSHTA